MFTDIFPQAGLFLYYFDLLEKENCQNCKISMEAKKLSK